MTTTDTDTEAPTVLYRPTSVPDRWPHRRGVYEGVHVTWLMYHRETPLGHHLIADFNPGDGPDSTDPDLADELFTAAEADLLARYLKRAHNTTVTLNAEPVPVASVSPQGALYMPVSAMPVGGGADFHMLWKEDGYDLPFKVLGFYDMQQDLAPTLVAKWVWCHHHREHEVVGVDELDPDLRLLEQAEALRAQDAERADRDRDRARYEHVDDDFIPF